MWSATARILSASATDEPPNFCTTKDTRRHDTAGGAGGRRGLTGGVWRPVLRCPTVPSEKRARQDARRQEKVQQQERVRAQRRWVRRILTLAALGGVVVLIVFLLANNGNNKASSSSTTSSSVKAG